jgi:hypothetical protein
VPRVLAAIALGWSAATLAACAGFSANALPRQPASLTPIAGQASSALLQFTFKTVDDAADPGFNRLLGINNEGRVVGYYGNGAAGHPNRGYIVYPPYGQTSFRHVDYPSAVDTQVTSPNNKHTLAGVYVDSFGNTFGFIEWHGLWFNYEEPQERDYKPVTELRALNDTGTAVGFYAVNSTNNAAFEVVERTGKFHTIAVPGALSAVATGITGNGHVVGFEKRRSGIVVSYLLIQGVFTAFSFPHSNATRAWGITTYDRVVGSYVDRHGATHGFFVTDPGTKKAAWQSIDDPNGKGTTVVSGINIHGNLVGYYVDGKGKTHGFLATLKP